MKEKQCPLCKAKVLKTSDCVTQKGWYCISCGARGVAQYDLVFKEHTDIYDSNGLPCAPTEDEDGNT
mgnify:CR=1 FL=1